MSATAETIRRRTQRATQTRAERNRLTVIPDPEQPTGRRRPDPHWAPLVIRLAVTADGSAVRRLAELDSALPPVGETVIAEQAGTLVAAVSLDGWTAIADPFVATADILALLQLRAAQLRRAGIAPAA